ncbi:fimbrial protein [Aeromonas jandaei]|uniref:fimbrial protein n=1 Tax=Aeromonas jandaei TaxID=650 RepID=UPI001C5A762B|nr:fimbrial protein [Aeromonas jandaei]MBW3807002.1 fimbrial protein [Aeromonas jandaei]
MIRYLVSLLGVMMVSIPVFAINGEVIAPTKEYNIKLDKDSIQNVVGAQKQFGWDLKEDYPGVVYCPEADILKQPFYYKGSMIGGLPSVGGGFFKLNDFLDIKVEVWIAGGLQRFIEVPFENVSNQSNSWSCHKREGSKSIMFQSGSRGKVTFRVRKKIINGVSIQDHKVVEMYGRLGRYETGFNNSVMSRIVIESSILYVPEKCTINGGQEISVEFGDLPGTGLDGNNYEKTVPVNFVCSGGEFDQQVPLIINLAISGREPNLANGSGYLRTTRADGTEINNLGIKFKQLNGSPLKVTDWYPVSMRGNIGDWGFIASPITLSGTEVEAGDFYATGTIVASFP